MLWHKVTFYKTFNLLPKLRGLGFQFEFEVTLESLTSPFLILFSQFPSIPLKQLYQLQQS